MKEIQILIIDDEESARNLFREFLQEDPRFVTTAVESAEEALGLLRERKFDLFLVDKRLKDRNGLEFVAEIRKMGIKSPVVMISGFPDKDALASSRKLNVSSFVSKPITAKLLLRIISEALNVNGRKEFIYFEEAADGTKKYLMPLETGNKDLTSYLELASIFMPERSEEDQVICLSSQSGCKMGCKFCVTGTEMNSRVRNLSVDRMRSEIFTAETFDGFTTGPVLVSIMGMGEPSLNWRNIVRLIKESDERHFFAISSVGLITNLNQLIGEIGSDLKVKLLQISLHFPDDNLREKHIKAAKGNPIEKILKIAEKYSQLKGESVCLNYTLFDGINDSDEVIGKLVTLIKGRPFFVRLSEANPHREYQPVSEERFRRVEEILTSKLIPYKVFASRGKGTSGCGQMIAEVSKKYSR